MRAGLRQKAWGNRENCHQQASSQIAGGLPQIETHVLQPPMDLRPEYRNYTGRWMQDCSGGLSKEHKQSTAVVKHYFGLLNLFFLLSVPGHNLLVECLLGPARVVARRLAQR